MKRTGFTLIELLIVVGIIGVLAGLAISQFSKYKEESYFAAAKAHVSAAKTAAEVRISENPGVPFSIVVSPNGTILPTSPSLGVILPGYKHQVGVYLSVDYDGTTIAISSSHCSIALDVSGRSFYNYNNPPTSGTNSYSVTRSATSIGCP